MLDDPKVESTSEKSGVVRRQKLGDPKGHAFVSLLFAPQCTKANVERVFGYTATSPRVNMPQKWIFDDLAVADFLELQPVIRKLCQWIARVIKQQQTVEELKEHFEMSEIGQDMAAEGSTTHPSGLFSRLPAEFWVFSLFTILPNPQQDMMYKTCNAFRCFLQEYLKMQCSPTFVKLYAFMEGQGPKTLKGIKILLEDMQTIEDKKKEIAEKWVENCLDDPDSLPPTLSFWVGNVLLKEDEFDYQNALDDGIFPYRFTVIEIIQERQPEEDFVERILGSQPNQATPQQINKVEEAVMTLIDEARNEAVTFLKNERRFTKSFCKRIKTVLNRMTLGQPDVSYSDLEKLLRPLTTIQPSQSKGSTRSIGARKKQKTRGRGASGNGEVQARALKLREDLRTFPV